MSQFKKDAHYAINHQNLHNETAHDRRHYSLGNSLIKSIGQCDFYRPLNCFTIVVQQFKKKIVIFTRFVWKYYVCVDPYDAQIRLRWNQWSIDRCMKSSCEFRTAKISNVFVVPFHLTITTKRIGGEREANYNMVVLQSARFDVFIVFGKCVLFFIRLASNMLRMCVLCNRGWIWILCFHCGKKGKWFIFGKFWEIGWIMLLKSDAVVMIWSLID